LSPGAEPPRRVESTTPWTDHVGYSRAVRAGDLVFVSGTTSTGPDGEVRGLGDAYAQAREAIAGVATALSQIGLELDSVVRTRMFVTDISNWQEIGRAHREAFGEVLPATSMVEVSALIDPRLLVEVEAVAYAGAD
jgi:enamine deaminase RidA (YjgF/YER057c/UK114 family)